MKKRYLAVISLAVYVLLLLLLDGIVPWLIAGLIAGIASSLYLSKVYDQAYEKERARIRSEGLTIGPESIIGKKTNTLAFFITICLIFGILSFGLDSFISKFF